MSHGIIPGSNSHACMQLQSSSSAPLLKTCLSLFFPLAFSMISSSTVGIVDMYLASFLGNRAQAAVGLGDQLLFLLMVIGSGLATACGSFVSRSAGAAMPEHCRHYAAASLYIGGAIGIFSTILSIFWAADFLKFLGASGNLLSESSSYVIYTSLGNPSFIVLLCLSSIFRSLAKTRQAVYLWLLCAAVSNALSLSAFFSPFQSFHCLNALAFGWDIGVSVALIFGIQQFKKILKELPKQVREQQPAAIQFRKYCSELLQLAMPAVLAELGLLLSQFLFYRLLFELNPDQTLQAAWTVKLKLEETLAMIPLLALGMSAAVIVGHKSGAGKTQEAKSDCLKIAKYAAIFLLLPGLVLSVSANSLAPLFSQDGLTQKSTSLLLEPSVFSLPLCAFSTILCSGLDAAGKTIAPMTLNLIFQVLIKYALAHFLAIDLKMDLSGINLAVCLSQLLMTASVLCYFMKQELASELLPGAALRMQAGSEAVFKR
ncbi:MAG: hypothetical protein K2X27_23485 [Candidatus Obscuribacterales bacterium]|nr:hypothetical protein [Candidatus Obscuribacterales bacterium]